MTRTLATLQDDILAHVYLTIEGDPHFDFEVGDVADALGEPPDRVQLALVRLAEQHRVRLDARQPAVKSSFSVTSEGHSRAAELKELHPIETWGRRHSGLLLVLAAGAAIAGVVTALIGILFGN